MITFFMKLLGESERHAGFIRTKIQAHKRFTICPAVPAWNRTGDLSEVQLHGTAIKQIERGKGNRMRRRAARE